MKKVTIEGKEYKSIREACKELDISYDTVAARIRRGVPFEEAFTKVDKSFTAFGKHYDSLMAACKELGLNYNTVRGRINYGFKYEDALYSGKYVITHKDIERSKCNE